MTRPDPFQVADPDQLAIFVQEYVRRESEADAGTLAVIAAQMRDPQWLPHQLADVLLQKPEIQAAVKAIRQVYKPKGIQEVSVDTISMDMEAIYQDAKDARQFTAAIAAKKLQAEIRGILTKNVNIHVKHTVGTMADAQLEAIAKQAVIEGEFTDVTPEPQGLGAVTSE